MQGLVLEGGGVRGAYQVGAYKAFVKCGIKFDVVVGTSIGSFNAAMIVAGKWKELLAFWESADVANILGLDKELASLISKRKINLNLITGIASIIKSGGLKTEGMRLEMDKLFAEDEIRNSKMDYGLVTLRVSSLKPVEIFKEDIPKGKLKDYIIASCYLPVFKAEKIIDEGIYFDGGIINNSPVNMLLKKNCKKIYVVKLGSMGFYKKVKLEDTNTEVVYISPKEKLGSILALDKDVRLKNIKMGYFDTLKVLKKMDGYDYIFKSAGEWFYDFISRKVKKTDLRRVMNFFNTKTVKETIIKAVEFVLRRESVDNLDIYNIYKMIKRIKKEYQKDYFINNFIESLKII